MVDEQWPEQRPRVVAGRRKVPPDDAHHGPLIQPEQGLAALHFSPPEGVGLSRAKATPRSFPETLKRTITAMACPISLNTPSARRSRQV